MPLIYKTKGEAQEYAYYGLNHYEGCPHGCTYCYMLAMAKRFKFDFTHPRLRMNTDKLLEKLYKEAAKLSGTKKRVQLCFSTDPYQPIDIKHHLTRDVLFVLREFNIPFQILTKAGELPIRDFDLYSPNDLFGVTLTTMSRVEPLEPHAGSPISRIGLLREVHESGIKTLVSLEPVIWPAETFRIVEKTHEFVGLYKIGKLNRSDVSGFKNWKWFAERVVALCEKLGAKYYLKSNLARLLEPGSYHNTDWREVE